MLNTSNETAALVSTDAPVAIVAETPAAPKAKRVRKPKAAKPVAKPVKAVAKPAKPARVKRDDSARVALIRKHQAVVSAIYNGPSLSVRSSVRSPASAAYAELLASPKHRTDRSRLTARDESALRLIASNGGNAPSGFDPVALNLDRGNFSRLCSVGFIASAPNGRFTLTGDGRAAAKRVTASKAA